MLNLFINAKRKLNFICVSATIAATTTTTSTTTLRSTLLLFAEILRSLYQKKQSPQETIILYSFNTIFCCFINLDMAILVTMQLFHLLLFLWDRSYSENANLYHATSFSLSSSSSSSSSTSCSE
uniref:Uncharacterized protein n=1 Tax=Glossina brevipalpis TaxID=37001 RepID=A0A1A9X1E0_9MUSC